MKDLAIYLVLKGIDVSIDKSECIGLLPIYGDIRKKTSILTLHDFFLAQLTFTLRNLRVLSINTHLDSACVD